MSDWTVDTLKEHIEALLKERDRHLDERARGQKEAVDAALVAAEKAVNAALAAAEKAVATARTSQERVNEKQNEFRQALIDQQATFQPRESYEQSQKEVSRRLEQVEARSLTAGGVTTGRDRASEITAGRLLVVVGAASALTGLVTFIATHL
jgi:4-alpha-glucanotransferase